MEWDDPKTKTGFEEYVSKYYPAQDLGVVREAMEKWLSRLRKQETS